MVLLVVANRPVAEDRATAQGYHWRRQGAIQKPSTKGPGFLKLTPVFSAEKRETTWMDFSVCVCVFLFQ